MRAPRSFIAVLLCLASLSLLSCQGQAGSSTAGTTIEGFWGGCFGPDTGTLDDRVFVDFYLVTDPEDASFLGFWRFPDVFGGVATCRAREFEFAGQLEDLIAAGVLNGTSRTEYYDVTMEVSEDGNTINGTYLVTESIPRSGPGCAGETGTFVLARDAVPLRNGGPEVTCPGIVDTF